MSYDYKSYINNSVVRSVVDALIDDPQKDISVTKDNYGRTWSLKATHGKDVIVSESYGVTSLLERIWTAVVLFFKCWSSTFRMNFINGINLINVASQKNNDTEESDDVEDDIKQTPKKHEDSWTNITALGHLDSRLEKNYKAIIKANGSKKINYFITFTSGARSDALTSHGIRQTLETFPDPRIIILAKAGLEDDYEYKEEKVGDAALIYNSFLDDSFLAPRRPAELAKYLQKHK